MKLLAGLVAGLLVVGLAGMANATLIVRNTDAAGNQLIYDTDLNITWYDYTRGNVPIHSGAYGGDLWSASTDWATALEVSIDGVVYNDWRLPSTWAGNNTWGWGDDGTTQTGYNITDSELGHLYYTELGNKGFTKDGAYTSDMHIESTYIGLQNTGPFENLWPTNYWSERRYIDPVAPSFAWYFSMMRGDQQTHPMNGLGYAIAVRDGDVALSPPPPPDPDPSPVPEPATLLLLGTGLAGLAGTRLRSKKK